MFKVSNNDNRTTSLGTVFITALKSDYQLGQIKELNLFKVDSKNNLCLCIIIYIKFQHFFLHSCNLSEKF